MSKGNSVALGWTDIWIMGLVGLAGLISATLYPVLTEAFTSAGRVSASQIGRIATAEFIAFAVTALFGNKFLSTNRLRSTATIAAAVQVLAVLATARASGNFLVPIRAVFGAAGGVLVWIQYEFIARASNPGRLTGTYIAAMVTTAIALSWIAPNYVLPHFGVNGLIVFLGVPSMATMLIAPFGPRNLTPLLSTNEIVGSGVRLDGPSVCLLVSIVSWSCWMALLWVYAGPLAHVSQISETASKTFVGASLLLEIVGAAAGAAAAQSFRSRSVLGVGLTIDALLTITLWKGADSFGFITCFSVFGFLSYFMAPFYIQELAESDASRRSIIYFPGAQYLGTGIGPLAASAVVSEVDYSRGLLVGLGFVVVAMIALGWGLRLMRRT